DSGIASVLGRTFPSNPANADEFSIAKVARYFSPPTLSSAPSISSFSAAVVLLRLPFGLPLPLLGTVLAIVSWTTWLIDLLPLFNPAWLALFFFFCVLLNALPCLSNLPSGSRLISGFFSGVSIGSVSPTTSSVAPPLTGSDRVNGSSGALCLTALRGAYRRGFESRISTLAFLFT